MTVNVRMHPQYDGGKVVRWTVYAWEGHPLLGEIQGTRTYHATAREARAAAHAMRQNIKKAEETQ